MCPHIDKTWNARVFVRLVKCLSQCVNSMIIIHEVDYLVWMIMVIVGRVHSCLLQTWPETVHKSP